MENTLFYVSIFLLRIPNFYIFPLIPNSFLTTQAIARIFLALGVFCTLYKTNLQKWTISAADILCVLFFTSQSLSILNVVNIEAYMGRYKDILLSVCVFLVFQKVKINIPVLMKILLLTSIINSIFALIVIYYPPVRDFFQIFLYDRYFDLVLSDIGRGRYYSTSYDETIIPFLLSVSHYLVAAAILWVTLISNFRTKILALLFAVILYVILLKKKSVLPALQIILFLIGFVVISIMSTYFAIGSENYLDRFNFDDSTQTQTLTSRKKQIEFSFELGKTPFGIGLGNYFDYVPASQKNNRASINKAGQIHAKEVNDGIHNNFAAVLAEGGYISFLIYCVLVVYFIYFDFIHIIHMRVISARHLSMITFWSLFIYGFFNPGVAFSYQFQLWFFRALAHNEHLD